MIGSIGGVVESEIVESQVVYVDESQVINVESEVVNDVEEKE